MRPELQQILDDASADMCKEIDIGVLMDRLYNAHIISWNQYANIWDAKKEEACEIINSCLKLCDDSAYEEFRSIILDLGKQQFRDQHLPCANNVHNARQPTVKETMPCFKDVIEKYADQLVQIIEPDYGLLDWLVRMSVISPAQRQAIQEKPTSLERNYELLKHLSELKGKQRSDLAAALRATRQRHVVNALSSGLDDTKLSSVYGDVRPLTSHQRSIIDANYSSLIIERIFSGEDRLLRLLKDSGWITNDQLNVFRGDNTPTGANTRLLNILRRRCVGDYKQFLYYLILDHQMDIAKVLSGIYYDTKIPSESALNTMRQEVAENSAFNVGYYPDNPSRKRGRMLIIANIHFTRTSMLERSGTECDVANLIKLCSYLKLDVGVEHNLTAEEIKDACIKERKEFKEEWSVFALCILSHGANGVVYGTDCATLRLSVMMSLFDGTDCPALVGKPKLFFIQACQGDRIDRGVIGTHATDDAPVDNASKSHTSLNSGQIVQNPERANMALILASPPGYAAWRNMDDGSCFVTQLTKVLFEHAHERHFMDMMTQVAKEVNALDIGGARQVIATVTAIGRKLYLLPY